MNLFTEQIPTFDAEEQDILNSVAIGHSKTEFLKQLEFMIAVSTDSDMLALFNNLKAKIEAVTEEWDDLQGILPFPQIFSPGEDIESLEQEVTT